MVQNLFQNIDSRKATGADDIPGILLKKCAPNLAPSLTAIFIASFTAGELPQAFKQADITPVYKSGDRETASNYRPISLLPIVSKLLEKIVSTQLKAFLASNSLLPEIQFCLPRQPLNWRCPCISCESLTAGERLYKGHWLSLCRPEQGVW